MMMITEEIKVNSKIDIACCPRFAERALNFMLVYYLFS